MKKLLLLALFVVSVAVFAAPMNYNVKSYGAKGDGVTDDTDAIQKAADAARRERNKANLVYGIHRYERTHRNTTQGEIFLPAGKYLISRTILMDNAMVIRGEKGTVIIQKNPEQDILFMHYTSYSRAENIAFEGGNIQIHHWTNNIDQAGLRIVNCTFNGAKTAGIKSTMYRYKDKKQKYLSRADEVAFGTLQDLNASPFILKRENGKVIFERIAPERLKEFENSTNLIVDQCRFQNNREDIFINADGIIVRDCHFLVNGNDNTASISMAGRGRLENSTIHFTGTPGKNQYAVKHREGAMLLDNVKITSANNVPVPAVRTTANRRSSQIRLKNVTCNVPAAIVSVEAKVMPRLIMFQNVTHTGKNKVQALQFDKTPNRAWLNMWAKRERDIHISHDPSRPPLPDGEFFRIVAGNNSSNIAFDLTPDLQKIFETIPDGFAVKQISRGTAPVFSGKVIYADDLGAATLDAAKDETEKLKAYIAKAQQTPGTTLCIPARWIKVNDTFNITGDMKLISCGAGGIVGTNDEKPIFKVSGNAVLFLKDTIFRGGKNLVDFSNGYTGKVWVENCIAYDAKEGMFHAANSPAAVLTVLDGLFFTPRLYTGNAKYAIFDSCWLSSAPDIPRGQYSKDYAFIKADGGTVQWKNILTVPYYFRRVPMNKIWKIWDPALNGHFRWVDTKGCFLSFDCRYGGEWGGLTPVYLHGKNASAYIEGGTTSVNCPRIVAAPFVLDDERAAAKALALSIYINCSFRESSPKLLKDGQIQPLKNYKAIGMIPYPSQK